MKLINSSSKTGAAGDFVNMRARQGASVRTWVASRNPQTPSQQASQSRWFGAWRNGGEIAVASLGVVHHPLGEEAGNMVLWAAVGANTCASPIQPMRSSRCGQSVGTLRKLPRWPQTMFW
jgi:hypothetical protein